MNFKPGKEAFARRNFRCVEVMVISMSDCVNFGIIPNIEFDKDYSKIHGPEAYREILQEHNCVCVSDDIVNEWIPLTEELPTFFCALCNPFNGIDHYGVTLIPLESIKAFRDVVWSYTEKTNDPKVSALVGLLDTALSKGQYVICYGI